LQTLFVPEERFVGNIKIHTVQRSIRTHGADVLM